MKEKLFKILEAIYRYNSPEMPYLTFNVSREDTFDLAVVAPTYTPQKLDMQRYCEIKELIIYPSVSVYLLTHNNQKILWVVTSCSDSNQVDYLTLLSALNFKRIVFIGAVGALRSKMMLGDLYTPIYSICGGMANTYLKDSIKDYVPFEKYSLEDKALTNSLLEIAQKKNIDIKKGTVFCTPSVSLEYVHLDEIKSFDTDLIEMETATFMALANLIEKPAAILLVVSDNSSNGEPIVGKTEEQLNKYHKTRKEILPSLLFDLVEL